ncbi:MAG: response regulator [Candidatus Magnetoovum sp. WYHC-5]|nr:response regulator [Candidatus Magnetoovum sp. WYHC-5]
MRKYRLLIIDDLMEDRVFLKNSLEKNCEALIVDELIDIAHAKDKIEQSDYELILCKWRASEGKELIQWIRDHPIKCNMPLITFTDVDDKDGIVNSIKYGANAYLIAPFSVDKLIQKIMVINERLDRRQFGRCKANNPVLLKFGSSFSDGELIDISMGGLYGVFIFEDTFPRILEKVIINLEYENQPMVFEVHGTILRIEVSDIFEGSTSLKMSIKFVDLTDKDNKYLDGFLLSLDSNS